MATVSASISNSRAISSARRPRPARSATTISVGVSPCPCSTIAVRGSHGIDPGNPRDYVLRLLPLCCELGSELRARADVQLAVDLGEVPLHGLRADRQRTGNFRIRTA